MAEAVDFTDDILQYLRERRGKLTETMRMIVDLSRRVKGRTESRNVRGQLLSSLAALTRQKRVIRYRRATMVKRRPRSSQGLVRISEVCC